mgnify:FL=1
MRRDVYSAMRERERSEKELFSHVDAQDLKAIEEDNAALGKSVEKEYQILIQLHEDLASRVDKINVESRRRVDV